MSQQAVGCQEALICPRCGLVLKNPEHLRCPRCWHLLRQLACSGRCQDCRGTGRDCH